MQGFGAPLYGTDTPTRSSHPPHLGGTKRAASSPTHAFKLSSSMGATTPSNSRTTTNNASQLMSRKVSGALLNNNPSGKSSTQPLFASSSAQRRGPVSKQPARQMNGPTPYKASQNISLPFWRTSDDARAASSRRLATMSVSGRSAPMNHYREISNKNHTYLNQDLGQEYDSSNDEPKPASRRAARKIEEKKCSLGDGSSPSSEDSADSDSASTESGSEIPDTDSEDDVSDHSIEIIDSRPVAAIELLRPSPGLVSHPATPQPTPTPSEEMIAVMERLTLSTECMQKVKRLPFMRRNLRRGFQNYCRVIAIPTEASPHAPRPSIMVIFKLAINETPPHEAHISSWECPICNLHSPFGTKEMLETHLDRNHDEVHTAWEESNDKCRWRLLLLFTGKIGEDDLSPTTAISSELISPDGTGLGAVPVEPPQSAVTETVVPQNPLGPTARFPYLPAKSDYGGPDLKYSVRFGGPKIYDLLGSLPMEPFGVLAWAVLDREEEIFESDDIKDEYKVMHALWARWVTLNRNVFVADYFAGIKQFVDTYWKMIRWAAGWDALRYWLLMLMVNRFITGRDVAHILRYYEHKLEIAVIGKSDGI